MHPYPEQQAHTTGCLVCGSPLVYTTQALPHTCSMCGGRFEANATCEAGHFICDACHTAGQPDLKGLMLATTERDPIRVKLRFSPRVAGRVRATQWHRSEETCEGKDGYLIWEAQIAEPQEMMPWIRGWGAEVEVLEPDYLHKELRDEVLRMMALYGLEAR